MKFLKLLIIALLFFCCSSDKQYNERGKTKKTQAIESQKLINKENQVL